MPSLSNTANFQLRKPSVYNRTARFQRSPALLSLNSGNKRDSVFRGFKVCRFAFRRNPLLLKSVFKQTRNHAMKNRKYFQKFKLARAPRRHTTKNLDSQISLPLKNSGSVSPVVCTVFHPIDTSLLGDFDQCGTNEHLMDSQTLERLRTLWSSRIEIQEESLSPDFVLLELARASSPRHWIASDLVSSTIG